MQKTLFPTSEAIWQDWRWHMRHAVAHTNDLENVLQLTENEKFAIQQLEQKGGLPLLLTPHILSQIDANHTQDPIRQQLIPKHHEFSVYDIERTDPLGEEDHEVVPHLIHRYPDRVLFLVTDRCASHCRYCHRKRWVGQGPTPKQEEHQQAIDYIKAHPQIKEVIFSGGDPLLLSDSKLKSLLEQLKEIPHVEVLRIHTRILTLLPQRITQNLVEILEQYQPLYIVAQFNHPKEISPESELSIKMLANKGIQLLNQSVLLKNINDSTDILSELFWKLVRLRVKPYDLHQCDIIKGATHFRVPLKHALELIKSLRGHISGLCIPHFMIDIPGGFGKVALAPNPIIEEKENSILLQGFDGEIAEYPLD